MSLLNQTSSMLTAAPAASQKSKRTKQLFKESTDFCQIGGLANHLRILREIIILPLLHGNVYTHFNIKTPRGVLFHGPPGTGKTLVAGALATEMNREGIGKVAFFNRKGADCLDKWVGGSEKNLKELFEKAAKSRPAIIFFDEIDGLAPQRDKQNDHVHASIVATLLALMDGLDTKPGVIVIGATNRIESVDPALRRPGRFDKELYFPLPGCEARKQIIEVHTSTWKNKPSTDLIMTLVETTSGYSGADLQQLCSEAIIRCMRRIYPNLKGIKIEPEKLKVIDEDFLDAKMSQVPSTQRTGVKMRKLATIIKPVLEKQLNRIVKSVVTFWPHFFDENYRYNFGEERYAGRILLIGSHMQGLDTHLIPALLQKLEYLPVTIYDAIEAARIQQHDKFKCNTQNASIILLSKVDKWWDTMNECDQLSLVSSLEDIHAGLPVLVVATCRRDVPVMHFFYDNSSILLNIEDPTEGERMEFFKPLFFDRTIVSLVSVLENGNSGFRERRSKRLSKKAAITPSNQSKKRKTRSPYLTPRKKQKIDSDPKLKRTNSLGSLYDIQNVKKELGLKRSNSVCVLSQKSSAQENSYFSAVLSNLLIESDNTTLKTVLNSRKMKFEDEDDIDDGQMQQIITNLWKHVSSVTSDKMAVTQLELLYDVIAACINIHWNSLDNLMKHLEDILNNVESSRNLHQELN